MMLEHVGHREGAKRIEASVAKTLAKGEGLTRDLGGTGNTRSLTDQIINNLG